jgi:hypothetical protein
MQSAAVQAMCEDAVRGASRWAEGHWGDGEWGQLTARLDVVGRGQQQRVALVLEVGPLVRVHRIRGDALMRIDVLVGFGLDDNAHTRELRAGVEVDVTVDMAIPLVGAASSTCTTPLSLEDVIVPAWHGTSVLPLAAVAHLTGVRVAVRPPEAARWMYAVVARLRPPDVAAAFAASRFDLPCDGLHAQADADADPDGARVVLPDLERMLQLHPHSCRGAAAAARARQRRDAVLEDLMRAAWAPRRVRAGAVDPDW